jgi:hypothetical protein
MDAEGIEEAVVLGHSEGGTLAVLSAGSGDHERTCRTKGTKPIKWWVTPAVTGPQPGATDQPYRSSSQSNGALLRCDPNDLATWIDTYRRYPRAGGQ